MYNRRRYQQWVGDALNQTALEGEIMTEEALQTRKMMSFAQSIETCFSKYATFEGRASRAEYWWFNLFVILATPIGGFILGVILGYSLATVGISWQTIEEIATLADFVLGVFIVIPQIAVGTRRLHDIGRSGWWQLLHLTIIGSIPLIVMFCFRTKPQANQYGDSPV